MAEPTPGTDPEPDSEGQRRRRPNRAWRRWAKPMIRLVATFTAEFVRAWFRADG